MIRTYHRPATLDEALSLLQSDGAVVLAGGTTLVASGSAEVIVDLQALGLDDISIDGDRISIGAMARLSDVADADLAPPLLRDLARREAPSTIRNVATVGGTVAAADPESELLAGLLAYEADVVVAGAGGTATHALGAYFEGHPPGIITSISVQPGGAARAVRTGRTPADRPIVAAVARRSEDRIILALTGVEPTPIAVDPERVGDLDPPSDFRGSSEYRRHLATTLAARAIRDLEA